MGKSVFESDQILDKLSKEKVPSAVGQTQTEEQSSSIEDRDKVIYSSIFRCHLRP